MTCGRVEREGARYLFRFLGVPQKVAHDDDAGEIKAKISALPLLESF